MRIAGTRNKIAISVTILIIVAIALSIPQVRGDTLSGEASVNSQCKLISTSISTSTVDPESYFWVRNRIRDKDNLSDVENVIVKVFSTNESQDDKRNHYTFWFDASNNSWNSNLTNTLGDPYIDTSASEYPTDLTENEDNFNFKILLNGTATPKKEWNVYVEVNDKDTTDNNETNLETFSVNEYINYEIQQDKVVWTGLQPGTTDNPAANNPIIVKNIETNVNFNVETKFEKTNWESNKASDTIQGGYTTYVNTDANGSSQNMGTNWRDVYLGKQYGENISKGIEFLLTVPSDTDPGTYTNTFHIDVIKFQQDQFN